MGAVRPGDTVEFDLTGTVSGDGVYCFVIDSLPSNGVDYNSLEATTGWPVLTVDVAP